MNDSTFTFIDPGVLADGDLQLLLVERYPGNAAIGFVPAYKFHITRSGHDTQAGNIEFRAGHTADLINYGGHFAYGVHPQHRGHHYAARACKLLFPLARAHGFTELWITCNPDNLASRRTCEFAGAKLVEIVDLPERIDMNQEGERQKCRYRIIL